MYIVTYASNILEVGEREVFRRAHYEWFGSFDDRQESADFKRYFDDHERIPPYVRHFCRNIIREFEEHERSFLDLFKEWIKW